MTPWPISRGGRHRAGVDVLDGLGIAGRARRVHPERDLVGHGRRGERLRLAERQQVLEEQHVAVQSRLVLGARSDDDDRAQMRQAIADRQQRWRSGAATTTAAARLSREQVGILLGGEQRIDRYRNDAGADRAPERDGIIDGVVEQQHDAIFLAQAQRPQRRREAAGARLQLAVGQRAFGIRECDLVAETARDIGIDEIGDGVVGPALQEVFKHGSMHPRMPRHRGSSDDRPSPHPSRGFT